MDGASWVWTTSEAPSSLLTRVHICSSPVPWQSQTASNRRLRFRVCMYWMCKSTRGNKPCLYGQMDWAGACGMEREKCNMKRGAVKLQEWWMRQSNVESGKTKKLWCWSQLIGMIWLTDKCFIWCTCAQFGSKMETPSYLFQIWHRPDSNQSFSGLLLICCHKAHQTPTLVLLTLLTWFRQSFTPKRSQRRILNFLREIIKIHALFDLHLSRKEMHPLSFTLSDQFVFPL